MRLLALTYPLTPVSESACGGTEQVAYQLLRGLAQCGRDIEVEWIGAARSDARRVGIACTSWPAILERYDLARPQPAQYTPGQLADLEQRCNRAVALYAADHVSQLIHNQGAWFAHAAAGVEMPVLFTLHLAHSLYPPNLLEAPPPNLHFQCVSRTQWQRYGQAACCGVIGNGIDLDLYPARRHPPGADAPLLYLGRMCPEKGPHLAIAIARRARRRLWLAGAVAPFPSHQRYLQECILPHLGAAIRWLPAPGAAEKRALLSAAAAVLIPSLIEETSSLVAMEAAASGIPVLALRTGALPEIVTDGETGFLADGWEELADAAQRLRLSPRRGGIAPAACRARAERDFSARRMVSAYIDLYRQLAA